jgi:hypothetical protein
MVEPKPVQMAPVVSESEAWDRAAWDGKASTILESWGK